MDGHVYGFHSAAGEALVRRLIGGVLADVEADRTSRRRALDRVSDALERAVGLDGAQPEQDVLESLAQRLNGAFSRAGYLPVSGEVMREHWSEWSRRGSPVNPEDICPAAVVAAASAAAEVVETAGALRRHGLSVAGSAAAPWDEGFCPGGEAPADLVLFAWRGETGGDAYVGCVAMSPEGACYVEDVALCGDPAQALRDGALGSRSPAECEAIAPGLCRLHAAVARFNVATAAAREPSRLSVEVASGEALAVTALWDGEPIRSVPRAAAPAEPVPLSEAMLPVGFQADAAPAPSPAPAPVREPEEAEASAPGMR